MMTVTVTLKYYLGQVKTAKGYNYVHMVVIMYLQFFHFSNDKDLKFYLLTVLQADI